jgi:hypothetical protein
MGTMGFVLQFLFQMAFAADTYELANKYSYIDSKDFSIIENYVTTHSANSPDDFLTFWKKERPEYFSDYVLAYRSRSLQKASPMAPRVVMFNTNADMVIAFNGHEKFKGHEVIEMMRFNHLQKSFEFYEMSFQEGRPQLSAPNPKKCLECHQGANRVGVDPRPNWEPYNTWPGFYGSIGDHTDLFFNISTVSSKGYDPEVDALLLSEFPQETQWHNDFKRDVAPTHPRYKLLVMNQLDQYGNEGSTLNGDLTNRLTALNFQRVARLIREQDPIFYNKVKWTIWGHANCGQNVFLKKDIFAWLYSQVPNKDYDRYLQQESQKSPPSYGHHPEMDAKVPYEPPPPPEFVNTDASDVINVMLEAFGVSTEDWSTDFKTDGGRFAAFERFGVANDPRPPWTQAIKRMWSDDPDFKNITCESVKIKSMGQFPSLEETQTWREKRLSSLPVPAEKPLLVRCISCHVDDVGIIPPIPFDNPQQLKVALQKPGYKRGTLLDEIIFRTGPHATEEEQMPRRGIPSTKQKDDLIEYLRNL